MEQMAYLQREMSVMRELHHANVVEWFHTIENSTDIYAVLEFCGGGTLFEFVKKKKGLSEAEAKMVFVQILSALLYMHTKSIFLFSFSISELSDQTLFLVCNVAYCHRDMKCENVLIVSSKPHLNVKVLFKA